MAKKFILVDDLDGESVATKTIRFEAFGRSYTIDLNDAHAAELNEVLTKYASVATEVVSPNRLAAKSIRTPSEWNEIRNWARSQGHNVSDKGRVPQHIVLSFEKAQAKAEEAVTAPETTAEALNEVPEGDDTPETVETGVEALKPQGVPAAEFSAEMGEVLSLNAPRKNAGKAKAGAGK